MAKFSFPIPGRKHTHNTAAKEKDLRVDSSSGTSSKSSNHQILSKAQRILGMDNDLNIDAQRRDEFFDSSSGMSISISESTQSTRSTNETGSLSGSNADQWEHESGVFAKSQRLRGKASSTILGQHYGEDGATDASSLSRRMRHEGSDSTLKSYYDRQMSPLSISQQTSASSARDLALRKGFPPVIPRSPLLQVESITDPFDQRFAENNHDEALSRERPAKKKPAQLDLSNLFSRSKKTGTASLVSTDASVARNPNSGLRRLTKQPSKESMQSQKHSIRSPQSINPKERQTSTSDTLYNVYDHYAHSPIRSPHMSQIPEARVPDRERQPRKSENSKHPQPDSTPSRHTPKSSRESRSQTEHSRTKNSHLSPSDGHSFSWKSEHPPAPTPPWDISSAASISSHNTKTSRHTSASLLSNSDLKQSSVLSLSGSEDEESDLEPNLPKMSSHSAFDDKASRTLNGSSQQTLPDRRQSAQKPQAPVTRKQGSRNGAAKTSPFLTIPEASFPSTRISGPWSPPEIERSSTNSRSSYKKEQKPSRKASSASSHRSSQHPTPPLSPKSVEFREGRERSGRYMAVTKQEEALLEALRQKRARMREKIIEEHETAKSPPRISNRSTSRYSEASSVSTLRGPDRSGHSNVGQILLYLDTPISDVHPMDAAEPSPDLSDFLSFGSDEDSTPRTSWAPGKKDKPRPDSSIRKSEKISPATPPSAARLSAVGTVNFRGPRSDSKKRAPGVRFVDENKMVDSVNPPDFLMDENENDVIWGM